MQAPSFTTEVIIDSVDRKVLVFRVVGGPMNAGSTVVFCTCAHEYLT